MSSTRTTATALWIESPGTAAHRREPLPVRSDSEIIVATLYSGISRGTERLVFEGKVPESEYERMRGPNMSGSFPGPVCYGYMTVGRVEAGPDPLEGRHVYCLHPHQDIFVVRADDVVPLPSGLPPGRAILGANMETALNITWDARLAPGDRVAVIGAGVVGALAASLAARIPGTDVTLVDTNHSRAALAEALGLAFASPASAPAECDVAINTSASDAGLATAIRCAGDEARVVEASWYGARPATIPLGGAFHSRRLAITAS